MNKKPLKPKNGLIIDKDGNKRWYKDDQLHRLDGYAVELIDGTKEFWVEGDKCYIRDFLHYFTGNKLVCKDGIFHVENFMLHREDGPAYEEADGSKRWYVNGRRHRVDGPAVETPDGTKHWWVNDQLHREDGPALEQADGSTYWYTNNNLHREDGPAIQYAKGDKYWYIHGKQHREDGPAAEFADGGRAWYINGKLHREDGPAREWADGNKEWYINGVQVTEQIVMQPESITLAQIQESRNNEVRSIMIERYGWLRYLTDINAKILDKRDNLVENTKEALFAAGELGNRLVVTCPTGRVFTLGVPSNINNCEEAQQWLGNSSKEINVIGRT